MTQTDASPAGRRSFLTRLGSWLGVSALGATSLGAQQPAQQPARGPLVHPEDAWLDTLPRGHRMVFDAFSLPGAVNAGRYCGNWIMSNGTGYGLKPDQLGAVIVLRSAATIYAYDDAMWAKYPQLAQQSRLTDAATSKPYDYNPFLRAPSGNAPTQGVQWNGLASQGVHFAVCNGTTTLLAGMIAGNDAKAAETVRQELAAHLVPNGHLMATGIVALGRAQEKGFTFGCGG